MSSFVREWKSTPWWQRMLLISALMLAIAGLVLTMVILVFAVYLLLGSLVALPPLPEGSITVYLVIGVYGLIAVALAVAGVWLAWKQRKSEEQARRWVADQEAYERGYPDRSK